LLINAAKIHLFPDKKQLFETKSGILKILTKRAARKAVNVGNPDFFALLLQIGLF